jgi:hypothetical protein
MNNIRSSKTVNTSIQFTAD